MDIFPAQMAHSIPIKLSVLVPNRNGGTYLSACLASIIAQKTPEIELLVLDGASSDNSVDIIRSFGALVDYWESAPDSGQADALQKGLARARGEWVCYLNSDDVFFPGAFEEFFRLATADSTWISGSIAYLDAEGNRTGSRAPVWKKNYPAGWITYENTIPQMAVFIRRKVLLDAGGFDISYSRCMDTELWLRLDLAGNNVTITNRILAGFRFHGASKTAAGRLPFILEHRKMLNEHGSKLAPDQLDIASRKMNALEAEHRVYEASNKSGILVLEGLLEAAKMHPPVVFKRYFLGALKRAFA